MTAKEAREKARNQLTYALLHAHGEDVESLATAIAFAGAALTLLYAADQTGNAKNIAAAKLTAAMAEARAAVGGGS